MKEKINSEHHVGVDKISIKSSTVIKLKEYFTVYTDDGPIDLTTEITADLEKIPEKYHEVFLNLLTSKYLNKVSFGENPFSLCKPHKKNRFWEFWKKK